MRVPSINFRETLAWVGWLIFCFASIGVFLPLISSTGVLDHNGIFTEFYFPPKLVWNTLRISIISGILCLISALILAILVSQLEGTIQTYFERSMLLAGFIPTVLRSFGWLGVWQFAAFFANSPLLARGSLAKVTLGLVHLYIPFTTFLILQMILRFDSAQIKAAMACNIQPWKIFLFIMLPQFGRPLLGILILLIVLYTGAIVTPTILGSGHETMLVEEISRIMNIELSPYRASSLAIILLTIIALGSFASIRLTKRIGYEEH